MSHPKPHTETTSDIAVPSVPDIATLSVPDIAALSLAELDRLDNPMLQRVVGRLLVAVDRSDPPVAGFNSAI